MSDIEVPEDLESLKPEHMRALQTLSARLNSSEKIFTPEEIGEEIWQENSFKLIDHPFATKDIPNGSYWRWNQTKSRRTARLISQHSKVNLFKLIPRRRQTKVVSKTSLPKIKLWQFEIEDEDTNNITHALWCERGLSPDGTVFHFSNIKEKKKENKQKKEKKDSITLNISDFVFLAPLMNPDTAQQLFPQLNDNNV
mmetsp:Transcript_34790/g.59643  ORF Transcript_34790/g.59643 Transcript_34790/m.59643 type:complete len:197 (-) Transcript_34790:67-657(-)